MKQENESMRRNDEICVGRSYSENSRESISERSEILIERKEGII